MTKPGERLESTQQELVRPKVDQTNGDGELRGCGEEGESDDDKIFMEMFDERKEIDGEEEANRGRGSVVEGKGEMGNEGDGLSQEGAQEEKEREKREEYRKD